MNRNAILSMRILSLFLWMITLTVVSMAQPYSGSFAMVGKGGNYSRQLFSDTLGYLYITGEMDTLDFDYGPGTYALTGKDKFIAKYTEQGRLVWVKKRSMGAAVDYTSIDVDGGGNVYLTGHFYGIVDMDPGPGVWNLVSKGSSDVFVAKYDPDGNIVFAFSVGSTAKDSAFYLEAGVGDDIYLYGGHRGTIDMDPGTGVKNLTSSSSRRHFYSVYSKSGLYKKANTTTLRMQKNSKIDIDSKGNLFMVYSIDAYPNGWRPYYATFVDKMTTNGAVQWSRMLTDTSGNTLGLSSFELNDQEMTIGGTFTQTVKFKGTSFSLYNGSIIWGRFYTVTLDTNGFVTVANDYGNPGLYLSGMNVNYTPYKLILAYMYCCQSMTSWDPFHVNILGIPFVGGSFGQNNTTDESLNDVCGNIHGDVFYTGTYMDTTDVDPGGGTHLLYPDSSSSPFFGRSIYVSRHESACGSVSNPSKPVLDYVGSSTAGCTPLNAYKFYIKSGSLNDGQHWVWFADSCNGTLLGVGDTLTLDPIDTTLSTIFVRGEGRCGAIGACGSLYFRKQDYSLDLYPDMCRGGVYTFPDGDTSSVSRIDTSVLKTVHNCDSTIISQLTVYNDYFIPKQTSICKGTVFVFPDGDTTSISTIDTSYLKSAFGCDSTIVTQLTVNSAVHTSQQTNICYGQVYTFRDGDTSSISLVDTTTILIPGSCDSVYITQLTVDPPLIGYRNASICQGSVYTFIDGDTSSVATVDTSYLPIPGACDSSIVTYLGIIPSYHQIVEPSICQGNTYTFPNGDTGTVAQVHMSKLSSIFGCDSLIETRLHVFPSYHRQDTVHICQGSYYTLPDGNQVNAPGNYPTFFYTKANCDSTVETILIVDSVHLNQSQVSICQGDVYTFPNGRTSKKTTTDSTVYTNQYGCDSTEIIQLTVKPLDTTVTQNNTTLEAQDKSANQYTWIDCQNGQVIAGANQSTYTANANGSYALVITRNGCVDTSACYTITTVGWKGEPSSQSPIQVYPNPTSGTFYLNYPEANESFNVFLIDGKGSVVLERRKVNKRLLELDLSTYPNGIYYLRVSTSNGEKQFKIQKQD